MTERPTMFEDLPADAFPVVINFIAMDTRELVHTISIAGPGVVEIPGFAPRKVAVEVLFADGQRTYQEPD